jgi:hypothetical protein
MLAESIRAAAEAAADLRWSTHGRLGLARVRLSTSPEGAAELLAREAEQALVVFERLGDQLGLGWAHLSLRDVAAMSGRVNVMATETQLAAEHLTRAGRSQRAQLNTSLALVSMMIGDHPASRGLVEARRRLNTADGRRQRTFAWTAVAFFAALLGRAEEEQQAREHAERLQAELGTYATTEAGGNFFGFAALACGNAAEAAELLARTCAAEEATGDAGHLSTTAALHAHALLLTGDHHTARQQVNLALAIGSADDVLTQGLARSALAWLAARDGEDPGAVRQHMTDALAALEPTELVIDRALVHTACAEAARLLGDETAARRHRQAAIDLYDAKENLVGAAIQRALL